MGHAHKSLIPSLGIPGSFNISLFIMTLSKLVVLVLIINITLYGNTLGYSISKSPDDIQLYFHSATNVSQEIIYMKNETISKAFPEGKPTVFIIHGFWSDKDSDMPVQLTQAYLDGKINANIIVVSWGKLVNSLPPSEDDKNAAFLDALDNFPVCAERVASFIMWMRSMGYLKLETTHIVGHSLGAHTSGMVGKLVKEKAGTQLQRITGLDPAGPGFEFSLGLHTFSDYRRKISKEDATFVDIYHTGMAAKGDTTFDGHVDFYPNGGLTHTECPDNDLYGTCEHAIVVDYYKATILGKKYIGCMCNPEDFSDGSECKGMCDKETVTPGEFVPFSARGQYYFKTDK